MSYEILIILKIIDVIWGMLWIKKVNNNIFAFDEG
jgi:hypothetical protein